MFYSKKATISGTWLLALTTCCLSYPMSSIYKKPHTYDHFNVPISTDFEPYVFEPRMNSDGTMLYEDENDDAFEPETELTRKTYDHNWKDGFEPYVFDPRMNQDGTPYGRNEGFESYLLDPQMRMGPEPYDYNQDAGIEYYEPQISNYENLYTSPQVEALANLLYDTSPEEEIYGTMIHEKPVAELEELKKSAKMQRKENSGPEKRVAMVSTTPTTTVTSPIKTKVSTSAPGLKSFEPKSKMVPSYQGQKEYALLRPQSHSRPTEEGGPIIKQRSLGSEKKPSPYDTLRKYLSIEDAMKKEAQKRTAEMKNSQPVKRSFVSETDSLTSQLNKLKKTSS